jgi:hypothetical protein
VQLKLKPSQLLLLFLLLALKQLDLVESSSVLQLKHLIFAADLLVHFLQFQLLLLKYFHGFPFQLLPVSFLLPLELLQESTPPGLVIPLAGLSLFSQRLLPSYLMEDPLLDLLLLQFQSDVL